MKLIKIGVYLFVIINLVFGEEQEIVEGEEKLELKKQALKKLFSSTRKERNVPVIYNRDSSLFKEYMKARPPRRSTDNEKPNDDENSITFWGKLENPMMMMKTDSQSSSKSESNEIKDDMNEITFENLMKVKQLKDRKSPEDFPLSKEILKDIKMMEDYEKKLELDSSKPIKRLKRKLLKRKRFLKAKDFQATNSPGSKLQERLDAVKLKDVYVLDGVLFRKPTVNNQPIENNIQPTTAPTFNPFHPATTVTPTRPLFAQQTTKPTQQFIPAPSVPSIPSPTLPPSNFVEPLRKEVKTLFSPTPTPQKPLINNNPSSAGLGTIYREVFGNSNQPFQPEEKVKFLEDAQVEATLPPAILNSTKLLQTNDAPTLEKPNLPKPGEIYYKPAPEDATVGEIYYKPFFPTENPSKVNSFSSGVRFPGAARSIPIPLSGTFKTNYQSNSKPIRFPTS